MHDDTPSWLDSDEVGLIRSTLAVLTDLQQQIVHEFPKLRVGAVKCQRIRSIVCVVNLQLLDESRGKREWSSVKESNKTRTSATVVSVAFRQPTGKCCQTAKLANYVQLRTDL